MGDTQRRIVGYGLTVVLVSGLSYLGFLRHTAADLGTLLGAIDQQLRAADALPEKDPLGNVLSARAAMLDDVAVMIQQAAQQDPQLSCIEEYRGFLYRLRHEPRSAAACYRRARSLDECPPEVADTLCFNEARMLWQAGDGPAALQAFADHGERMQPKWRAQRDVECAEIMVATGQLDAAAARLEPVVAAAATEPMAAIRAGQLFEQIGRGAAAERAYQAAATASPIGTYRLAVLAQRQGRSDTGLELLERAAQAAPAAIGRLCRADRADWQALAADARVSAWLLPAEPVGPSR